MSERVVDWSSLGALLGDRVSLDEPLSRHSSLKIGGPADCMARPNDMPELRACLDLASKLGQPVFFLAGGTNLLVRDGGVRGLTIKLDGEFKDARFDGSVIRAGAAMPLGLLARKASLAGLAGLEFGVGIPGTLGGALVMNAGAHGQELKDVVRRVGAWEDGTLKELSAADCGFEYRSSRFKGASTLLLWAELELRPGNVDALKATMDTILKKRRETQPLELPNAGCVFKNPPQQSAGRLIEQAGLKGAQVGGARVSDLHANFVVNTGGASATDVLTLMARMRQSVSEKFGVDLQDEVLVIGEDL